MQRRSYCKRQQLHTLNDSVSQVQKHREYLPNAQDGVFTPFLLLSTADAVCGDGQHLHNWAKPQG